MPRLPILSRAEFVSVMRKVGYLPSPNRGKGSHWVLEHESRNRLTVPQEIGRGLLTKLIKDAGLTRDEFLNLL
ncbi:MAG: addiction module toxin, HicA family [Chloroflexi bacterium]|nr:addiction module toxin, HicA family [Chloroflexota bacterium]